jgi:hypothetical protein
MICVGISHKDYMDIYNWVRIHQGRLEQMAVRHRRHQRRKVLLHRYVPTLSLFLGACICSRFTFPFWQLS